VCFLWFGRPGKPPAKPNGPKSRWTVPLGDPISSLWNQEFSAWLAAGETSRPTPASKSTAPGAPSPEVPAPAVPTAPKPAPPAPPAPPWPPTSKTLVAPPLPKAPETPSTAPTPAGPATPETPTPPKPAEKQVEPVLPVEPPVVKPVLPPNPGPSAEPKPPAKEGPQAEVKPAAPGPLQPPVIDASELGVALKAAQDGVKPDAAVSPETYGKLCRLAEVVTFTKDPKAEEQKAVQDLLDSVAKTPGGVEQIGTLAKQLLEKMAPGGILLSGTVSAAREKDGLFGAALQVGTPPAAAMVLSSQSLGIEKDQPVLVLGSVVIDPAKNIAGYTGTQPLVIWAGMAAKAK
jgi:hypothetical protein